MKGLAQGHSRVDKNVGAFQVIAGLVVFASVYSFVRLSPHGLIYGMGLFVILEVIRLARLPRPVTIEQIGFSIAFVVTLLLVCWGVHKNAFQHRWTFLAATIFYRPEHFYRGNWRTAFVFGALILLVVGSVACGLVTEPVSLDLSGIAYVTLVAALWLLCSSSPFGRVSSD
jgi:hypothetical protein